MKIIHTSDWHIGKIVNQVSMLADQAYLLDNFIALLKSEKPDAVIIAGDIYDRAIPPVEAVELMDRVLCTITMELSIPLMIVAGNHDSPDRLGFGSNILKSKDLYIAGRFREEITPVSLYDAFGLVYFYLVPYVPPVVVKAVLKDPAITDHNTAVAAIVRKIKENWEPAARNILVTHGFITGIEEPEISDSERQLSYNLTVGGADCVSADLFEGFIYTALGHLHSAQQAGNSRTRYAGSLLKYSFSEVNQKKSVTVAEFDKDGQSQVRLVSLLPLRDMRKIKGELKALLEPDRQEKAELTDYLHITLTDDGELLEPMSKLKAVYPNVLALDFQRDNYLAERERTADSIEHKQKTKLQLFSEFYSYITGTEQDAGRFSIVAAAISRAEANERVF